MKNSFYLVTPEQKQNKELLALYEKSAVSQWGSSLPTASPISVARLFYDYIVQFNGIELPVQQRLDVLEQLRPHFIIIKNSFNTQLGGDSFPKGERELKNFDLLVSIEKNLTIGYWLVARELTHRDVGWFQGKDAALAIQRTIKGLAGIIVTYSNMLQPTPDWIWIDLHSLYKLSVKIKKEVSKVSEEAGFLGRSTSCEDSYIQILLFSLSDPSRLMQREIIQILGLISRISQFVSIEKQPVSEQDVQVVVLLDEDKKPYFNDECDSQKSTTKVFINLSKLKKVLSQTDKFSDKQQERFSVKNGSNNPIKNVSTSLLDGLIERWMGRGEVGKRLFLDRMDRYISVGLGEIHSLQSISSMDMKHEILAKSFSESELSCQFPRKRVLSIGSLVSYRQIDAPNYQRYLGVVRKITMPKLNGSVVFELMLLAEQVYAVSYLNITPNSDGERRKALLYRIKEGEYEKTYLLMDFSMHNNGDFLRMFMSDNDFPIILGGKENIGLGCWQFECRRIKENQVPQSVSKKAFGY